MGRRPPHFSTDVYTDHETDIEKLISSHCLILLHDITNSTIQNFVISLLIAQSFLYRKIHCGLQNRLEHIFVLDEAASLFRRRDEVKDHVSFINDVIKTARGYGFGFIAASQMATDLSHALLANSGTRMMVGGFGRTEDIDVFLRLRGCSPEQRQYVLNHPNVGKAFIIDERWPHIIECNLHNPAVPNRPTAEELQQRIEKSAQILTHKRETVVPAIDVTIEKKYGIALTPEASKKEVCISIEMRVLQHIYHDHFLRLKDRARALEIPSATLKRTITTLESNGFINVYKVHGRAGAPRDLYEVTDSGLKHISQPAMKMRGKGGYLHRFYQQQVARHFKSQGYRTSIEGTADEKNIDIIARKDGQECIAIEIELHSKENPDHILENFERAINATCTTQILCLVPTEAERKAVVKLVTRTPIMNKPVQVERLWKYLEK